MLQVPAILQWLIVDYDMFRSKQSLQFIDSGIERLSLDARWQHRQFALSLRDPREGLVLPHSCLGRISLVGEVCRDSGMAVFGKDGDGGDGLIVWSHGEKVQSLRFSPWYCAIASQCWPNTASLILDCLF